MYISPNSASQTLKAAKPISKASQLSSARGIDSITPQSHHYGHVAQLVNSRYLFELRKDIKKVIRGKKLKRVLNHQYSEEEFDNLPVSIQNLISFDRCISSAEILEFVEEFDKSHEIMFKDSKFSQMKFRALFEALGDLIDVEMQAGTNNYLPISDSFEIKRKIKEIFIELKDKIKDKLGFNKKEKDDGN